MPETSPINPAEIGTTYLGDNDRFVVSLVIGWSADEHITSARQALSAAIDLTAAEGSSDTQWYVFDRQTKQMHVFEQHEADEIECSECPAVVEPRDQYFASPCGTFCDGCMYKHAQGCDICRKEFDIPLDPMAQDHDPHAEVANG